MYQVQGRAYEQAPPILSAYRVNRGLKLAFDYALVIPALLLLAPLLLVVSLLIKLDSPGPIFYRRKVVGRKGLEFHAYKFRTMYVDGNDRLTRNRDGWMEVLRGGRLEEDPRLTRSGRFLRRTGLDELPRMFNVLDRSMSLVGPRMMTRNELFKMGGRIQGYTSVQPGLTGPWQLSGRYGDMEARARLESDYVRSWSVRQDLQILFRTAMVSFRVGA